MKETNVSACSLNMMQTFNQAFFTQLTLKHLSGESYKHPVFCKGQRPKNVLTKTNI
jgi:hypothetical protein